MIKYHINENGDIIGYSGMSSHTMDIGVHSITMTEPLDNYLNYYYVDGELVERQSIPYSIDKAVVETDELVTIDVAAGVDVVVMGPGTLISDITDGPIEFSSERSGIYTFSMALSPFKATQFQIEVK